MLRKRSISQNKTLGGGDSMATTNGIMNSNKRITRIKGGKNGKTKTKRKTRRKSYLRCCNIRSMLSCFMIILLFVFVNLFFYQSMLLNSNNNNTSSSSLFNMNWKWRRKIKKTIMEIKQILLPYFIRHPILSIQILFYKLQQYTSSSSQAEENILTTYTTTTTSFNNNNDNRGVLLREGGKKKKIQQQQQRQQQKQQHQFYIHNSWHPINRKDRFPSIDKRVQFYMSNWYYPFCDNNDNDNEKKENRLFYDYNISRSSTVGEMLSQVTIRQQQQQQTRIDDERDDDTVVATTIDSTLEHNKVLLIDRILINECLHPRSRSTNFKRRITKFLSQRRTRKKNKQQKDDNNSNNIDNNIINQINVRKAYCQDALDIINTYDDVTKKNQTFISNNHKKLHIQQIPLLALFGDDINDIYHLNDIIPIPVFSKYRSAKTIRNDNNDKKDTDNFDNDSNSNSYKNDNKYCIPRRSSKSSSLPSLAPIIWKLNTQRHWEPLNYAHQMDIPWKFKKSKAVWRGALTGQRKRRRMAIVGGDDAAVQQATKSSHNNTITTIITNEEKCNLYVRCSFVLQYINSQLMNIGLTDMLEETTGLPGMIEVLSSATNNADNMKSDMMLMNGNSNSNRIVMKKNVLKDMLSIEDLQEYKIIISIEGNDVSSGLKWQLLSSSIVLMARPTKSSWAMEELLQPFIHYVPLKDDLSDVEEQIQWILDNDDRAQRIAERSTLFMIDMIYHEDSLRDEYMIKTQIMQRYINHFVH